MVVQYAHREKRRTTFRATIAVVRCTCSFALYPLAQLPARVADGVIQPRILGRGNQSCRGTSNRIRRARPLERCVERRLSRIVEQVGNVAAIGSLKNIARGLMDGLWRPWHSPKA